RIFDFELLGSVGLDRGFFGIGVGYDFSIFVCILLCWFFFFLIKLIMLVKFFGYFFFFFTKKPLNFCESEHVVV
ncbi:hypothetical protein ACJBYR_10340, partial [Streptococcus suis]